MSDCPRKLGDAKVCVEGESGQNEARVTVYRDNDVIHYVITDEGIIIDTVINGEVVASGYRFHPEEV